MSEGFYGVPPFDVQKASLLEWLQLRNKKQWPVEGVSPLKLMGKRFGQLLKLVLKTKKGFTGLMFFSPATPDYGALECPK